jgi:NADPH2:quinone reductase
LNVSSSSVSKSPASAAIPHAPESAAPGAALLAVDLQTSLLGALSAVDAASVRARAGLALAAAHGCHHVIDYAREDFAARVKELTQGALCHAVYDGVGRATFPASLDCLRPFGMFVSFGNASGAVEAFDLGILARKGSLYATRPTLFSHIASRETYVSMAARLFRAISDGTLRAPAPRQFPLSECAKAHRALESRETTGSTILVP